MHGTLESCPAAATAAPITCLYNYAAVTDVSICVVKPHALFTHTHTHTQRPTAFPVRTKALCEEIVVGMLRLTCQICPEEGCSGISLHTCIGLCHVRDGTLPLSFLLFCLASSIVAVHTNWSSLLSWCAVPSQQPAVVLSPSVVSPSNKHSFHHNSKQS